MAATQQTSWSKRQREQGNAYFKSAGSDMGFIIRSGRLEAALQCYTNAFSFSQTVDEAVSAAKNIGTTAWKLASLNNAEEGRDKRIRKVVVTRYFKQAVEYFSKAFQQRTCKSAAWSRHLHDSMEKCVEEADEWFSNEEGPNERASAMGALMGYLPDGSVKVKQCLRLAAFLFHRGLAASQNFKECYRFMKECYYPINEAERLCHRDATIMTEVQILREDVYLHTCIAESGMARSTGDDLFHKGITSQEELNIDLIWDIMDWYRQSVNLCRNKDLEHEAIAYSRLGRMYGKVLQMSVRGKDFYKKAIELALSMSPRYFHNVDWFDESRKFVEDFQKRLYKEEDERKEKMDALDEVKEDLEQLKKIKKLPVEGFVEALYKTWPPKLMGATFNSQMTKKKLLLSAIRHYHPDKVDKEIHGNKWYYLTGEITKCLNEVYTREKFQDE